MKKYLLLTAICLCADVSYGALTKVAQNAVAKFHPTDPKGERAAFLVSAEARSILGKTNDEEGYLRELNAAFAKHERDLDAAALAGVGHDPAGHGGDAAAAVAVLDRDLKSAQALSRGHQTKLNRIRGKIQALPAQDLDDILRDGSHLHSDAKHTADVAAVRTAADATGYTRGRAEALTALQERIQPHVADGETQATVAAAATPLHSDAKYTADVAAAGAAGRAAGAAEVRVEAHAQLVTLMGHVNDDGAIPAAQKESIRGWVNDMIDALGAGAHIEAP